LRERLRALVRLSENETLRMLPTGVSQDLITAICLLHVSGKGASLILRGNKIDTMYLRGRLIKDVQPIGAAAVLGLMDRAVVAQIEPIDAPPRVCSLNFRSWRVPRLNSRAEINGFRTTTPSISRI